MKVDFQRERQWRDAKAPKEETDLSDEAVNRVLRWREIERYLDGIQTILCVGGGTGAFSIPLALLCTRETVEWLGKDEYLFEQFVDLCDRFDREMLPDGPGTRQRAG